MLQESNDSRRAIFELTLDAHLLARSAIKGAAEVLIGTSNGAAEAVNEVEKRLDELDHTLDEQVADAISHTTPPEARELLACIKAMVDLERVGDLAQSFAARAAAVRERISTEDVGILLKMCVALEAMLRDASEAFASRNVELAFGIIRADAELDRLRNLMVFRHTEQAASDVRESFHVLALAQSLERAGDHAKNVAEEVCHLVSGHSLRHMARQKNPSLEQMYLDHLFQQYAASPEKH
ncbi:MAG: hypothetical protein JO041_03225 [Acidobacteria bacterium]|nr:hypothetical protein [Acidobacteriota bacterium]